MPRSGLLRHKVTIQSATATQDAAGQDIKTWSNYGSWWCNITPQRGREFEASRSIQDEQIYKFQGRYVAGLTPQMRLTWNSKTFEITSVVTVNERDRMTEVMATEGVVEVNG